MRARFEEPEVIVTAFAVEDAITLTISGYAPDTGGDYEFGART